MKANFHPDTYARINDWMKQENLAALTKTTFQKPSIQCEQILDVGCGTGEFTRDRLLPSHHSCSKIVAVDVLSAMVDHARRNHGHSRISYEWTRDQEAAFRNIGRLLKEDGECLLFFSAPFYLFDVWLEMAGMERWKGILGDLKDIFPDIWHRDPSPSLSDLENSLRRLIADAGMTTLTCEVYSTEAYYPTLEVLLGKLSVLLPIVLVKSGTSEKETSSMRSELSSRLMKRFKMTPRGCSVPVDLFLFHTKKVVREGPTDV
ncbi:juvenile hormone acid O-methyltransferase isoform X3 [Ixodes scapularis]|uniref:juvenile hormone acid O-methyltransferase isoform X3 n=1 Tax=Ixodes scapularis TaxID=6945 RepID=UPI001A9F4732|nr:juvenile hormone acid O-methyltransferase isoform X3 [Ixodes scapularis]